MDGWVKLHRAMTEWEWYQDINTKTLFIHLLLKANTQDKLWQGKCIERGQYVSSYKHLSDETGLTVAQVRRAVENLKSTNEITHLNCGKYGLFTVVNYDKYQSHDRQTTGLQQADSRLIATTKEVKKDKKEKKEIIYTPQFEEFWDAYPRKTEKANCYEKYGARLKEGHSEAQLLEAAIKYADQCKKKGTAMSYIKHGATFLSAKKPFLDYLSSNSAYNEESTEYKLAKFFETYRKEIDSKFEFSDIQEACQLFNNLLSQDRNPNEIWGVMRALFTSNNKYLIRKYMDVKLFCLEFSNVGSSLALNKE